MNHHDIVDDYFAWLLGWVEKRHRGTGRSFRKLLTRLHEIEFRYLIPKDHNRAEDGADLRYRFALEFPEEYQDDILYILNGPCSVLEMMVALAIRCEEGIMDDPNIGDRTAQWFWGMIVSIGLGGMFDSEYDSRIVDYKIERFLEREYEPNGKGGLFTIRNCDRDLRGVEIWIQMMWYLDTLM